MLLKELQKQVNWLMERGHAENPVLITTKDPSVGCRGYSHITNILHGFDWEMGQIRIEPKEGLLSMKKDRDAPLRAIHRFYDMGTRKRNIWKCPKCEEHLRKSFRYCPKCGQRVVLSDEEISKG